MSSAKELADALIEWSEVFMHSQMTGLVAYARHRGISVSQAGTLFRLHGHRHPKGVSDIGDHLGVSSAAASQLLDRLVQQGLVLRSEDPDDRRAKQLSLTDKGREFVAGGMEGRRHWLSAIADAMTEEERGIVLSGLHILTRTVERTAQDREEFVRPFTEEETTQR